jgi:nitrite reductase/ring-hydroxylating ferredoxin subunit
MPVYDVGAVDDFPMGARRVVMLGRIPAGLFNVRGTLHALPNLCPHQQGPLCEGPTSGEWRCTAETGWRHELARPGEIVVCPWHGIEFDIATGRCLSSPTLRVRTFPVSVVDGRVMVSTERHLRETNPAE